MAKNATQNEAVSAFKLVFKWVFFTAIILTIVFGTFYVVPAGSRAVLLTFGKPSMQAVGE